jgi:hypothetical protein
LSSIVDHLTPDAMNRGKGASGCQAISTMIFFKDIRTFRIDEMNGRPGPYFDDSSRSLVFYY